MSETLKKIVHCSQDTFSSIAQGTHPTEIYTDEHLYAVELGEEITVGAAGSGLFINGDNQLEANIKEVSVSNTGTSTDTISYLTINGVEKKLPSGAWGGITGTLSNQTDLNTALNAKVGYVDHSNVSVAGTTKTVSSLNNPTVYVTNGLIMGGSAAAAGLVTRGICGCQPPNDTTGEASKDSLYINYDGNDTWNPATRGMVINAGSQGTNLGQNMYSYCAVRGDIVKAWSQAQVINNLTSTTTNQPLSAAQGKVLNDSKQATITSSTNLTCKLLTGGLSYVTTAPTAANTDGVKIAILSSAPATKYDGWLYFIAGA